MSVYKLVCALQCPILFLGFSQQDKGRPLPKFGEWDVNNPASAEGFTVIFNKARDEKKTSGAAVKMVTPRRNDYNDKNYPSYPQKVTLLINVILLTLNPLLQFYSFTVSLWDLFLLLLCMFLEN